VAGGGFNEIPGYGPRRNATGIRVDALEGRRLRTASGLRWLVVGVGAGNLLLFVSISLRTLEAEGRVGLGGWVMLALGVLVYAAALACLFVPVVEFRGDTILVRHPPWRRARVVPAWDVAWKPGARYVGRFLAHRSADGTRHRLPLWMSSRRDQEALFAWLDAHAGPRPAAE
jgi:hypothetical protein